MHTWIIYDIKDHNFEVNLFYELKKYVIWSDM